VSRFFLLIELVSKVDGVVLVLKFYEESVDRPTMTE